MPLTQYFNRPYKMAYHNLCSTLQPPPGIGSLLGLGLKFCIWSPKPSIPLINHSFDRFFLDVRLCYVFSGQDNTDYKLLDKKSMSNPTRIQGNKPILTWNQL